jgi:hypothetical protein
MVSKQAGLHLSSIALFVYKRPDHTRRTLEALMKCPEFSESPLYVFCDGAKRPEDQALVEQTREVVRFLAGDRAKILEASCNQGLANSIIAGVNQVVTQYGQVIVLEDDLVVSPVFLTYMNDALEKYRHENQVMQISGYMFPVPEFANRHDAMFLPFTVSWGWATWQRAWQYFDPEATGWQVLRRDRQLRKRFNLNGAYDYFSMMERQFRGECDSWAIRWYWSVFRRDGLVLFPPQTLVENRGFDGSGTHGSWVRCYKVDNLSKQFSFYLPDEIDIDKSNFSFICHNIQKTKFSFLSNFPKVYLDQGHFILKEG